MNNLVLYAIVQFVLYIREKINFNFIEDKNKIKYCVYTTLYKS